MKNPKRTSIILLVVAVASVPLVFLIGFALGSSESAGYAALGLLGIELFVILPLLGLLSLVFAMIASARKTRDSLVPGVQRRRSLWIWCGVAILAYVVTLSWLLSPPSGWGSDHFGSGIVVALPVTLGFLLIFGYAGYLLITRPPALTTGGAWGSMGRRALIVGATLVVLLGILVAVGATTWSLESQRRAIEHVRVAEHQAGRSLVEAQSKRVASCLNQEKAEAEFERIDRILATPEPIVSTESLADLRTNSAEARQNFDDVDFSGCTEWLDGVDVDQILKETGSAGWDRVQWKQVREALDSRAQPQSDGELTTAAHTATRSELEALSVRADAQRSEAGQVARTATTELLNPVDDVFGLVRRSGLQESIPAFAEAIIREVQPSEAEAEELRKLSRLASTGSNPEVDVETYISAASRMLAERR